ncbi:MAG: exodeoxyribonuclease VII small subunit [Bacteroidales bacterium]|nr:exodeoxyribonuclease VII small subunit [Bacteroidales bacterium]
MSTEKFSYDKSIEKADAIINDLQEGSSKSLDDMIKNVEEAVDLLKKCKTNLTETQDRLNRIMEED